MTKCWVSGIKEFALTLFDKRTLISILYVREKFVPASTAVACSYTNSAGPCAAARPVMRAGRTAATAVTAADGRIPVAELVEVAIGVNGVAAHQNCRCEV